MSGLGTNPQIPLPTGTQYDALKGNLNNMGYLSKLGSAINDYARNQAQTNLTSGLPGYKDMISQSSGNIQQMLAGQVPADVISAMLQGAAERGVQTGGGANANAAYLRALGLNSLQLQGQGEQALTNAIARTPQPAPFDLSRLLVTPAEQQSAAAANAIYAAAPNPTAVANANLAAARSGMGSGMGSYNGGGFMAGQGGSFMSQPWGNDKYGTLAAYGGGQDSLSTGGITYGNQVYYNGETPESVAAKNAANWQATYGNLGAAYPAVDTASYDPNSNEALWGEVFGDFGDYADYWG